ncbi:hypothetical protein M9H77_07434 [Catharanthus roseus]|uniref:Uncharacterized protein n=1 Tax=Catharanthus roseus TaxID=4058 RepID=A0ACC0BV75_CATRO|nr:hypothetical protein M9H77_07434 [Catharanthus roseus]
MANDHQKRYNQVLTSTLDEGMYNMCQYQGFWFRPLVLDRILSLQANFNPKELGLDVLICSAPKTGFTWLKSLCFAISTRNNFDEFTSPLHNYLPHDIIPCLELDFDQDNNQQIYYPLLSTHLPYISLPETIKLSTNCKIVYICRDPKDTFASLWHFMNKIGINQPTDICFQRFCDGKTGWGPYWDHVLGYWEASIEMPEKILFLKYEDLKNDTMFHVRKIAEFIGKPFAIEEETEGLVEKITKFCSFENMSNLEVNKSNEQRRIGPYEINNSAFFRNGNVGDWKNLLTVEMIEKIDEITGKKMTASGLEGALMRIKCKLN